MGASEISCAPRSLTNTLCSPNANREYIGYHFLTYSYVNKVSTSFFEEALFLLSEGRMLMGCSRDQGV